MEVLELKILLLATDAADGNWLSCAGTGDNVRNKDDEDANGDVDEDGDED